MFLMLLHACPVNQQNTAFLLIPFVVALSFIYVKSWQFHKMPKEMCWCRELLTGTSTVNLLSIVWSVSVLCYLMCNVLLIYFYQFCNVSKMLLNETCSFISYKSLNFHRERKKRLRLTTESRGESRPDWRWIHQ